MLSSRKALKAATIGVACQFCILPLLAYLMTVIFQVSSIQALGFILTGCMPGGSSSNVFTMFAQGVLELSVFMTLVSTLLAFGLTPLCLYVYGSAIGMDASTLPMVQIAQPFGMLVVPLSLGLLLNFCAPTTKQYIDKGGNLCRFGVFARDRPTFD